jgi:hypothetical protein
MYLFIWRLFMTNRRAVQRRSSVSAGISSFAFPRCIDKDDVLAFKPESEQRLLCTRGLLWATVQDDPTDYLVRGGKDLPVPAGRKLVVEAEEPSCFEID